MSTIVVSGLFIYPVKSLAGISIDSAKLDKMGLNFDRRWMVVDSDGKFMTQRTLPKMAVIKTGLDAEGHLSLSMQDKNTHYVEAVNDYSTQIEVTIWRDTLNVKMASHDTNAWLTDALGVECYLVYICEDVERQCDLEFAKNGDMTGFADGFPILMISQESLDDLNERLQDPVDMRRFRPNIVIQGAEAYIEDKMESFSIANISMKGVKLCSRCPVPLVDPDKGERLGHEPIQTLVKYRKWDSKVYFGMNVIHQQLGEIRVGDELKQL